MLPVTATDASCAVCSKDRLSLGEVWVSETFNSTVGRTQHNEVRLLCPKCAATFPDKQARREFLARQS
jgi:hypothetical protein